MSDIADFVRSRAQPAFTYIPGLVLVAIVTAAAYGLRTFPDVSVLSPMITAIFLGMLFANTSGVPAAAGPGMGLCGKKLLRAAVALLGLQVTLDHVAGAGVAGIAGAAVALTTTFLFTLWLGRLMGVSRALTWLLAGGVSICGASATRAREEEIAYAIACVTVFGTAAMFLYPLLMDVLGLGPSAYGQWIGFSVHEVAQVVAAGFQRGEVEGQAAVVAKLTRVMMLAPVVMCVAIAASRALRKETGERLSVARSFPVFVLAFIALAVANTLDLVPAPVHAAGVAATPVLLTAALAALGLATRFEHVMQHGLRPLILAGASSLFIASVSLLWVKAF